MDVACQPDPDSTALSLWSPFSLVFVLRLHWRWRLAEPSNRVFIEFRKESILTRLKNLLPTSKDRWPDPFYQEKKIHWMGGGETRTAAQIAESWDLLVCLTLAVIQTWSNVFLPSGRFPLSLFLSLSIFLGKHKASGLWMEAIFTSTAPRISTH